VPKDWPGKELELCEEAQAGSQAQGLLRPAKAPAALGAGMPRG